MTASQRRLAIASRKGGSGRTTTAVNLAAALAMRDERTLLVDLDPQASASLSVGVQANGPAPTIYELLLGMEPDPNRAVRSTRVDRLDIIPAAVRLAGAELELAGLPGRENRLKELLADIATDYSYVLVDCPSSFGLLALNALVACDEVMAPVQTQHLSVMAIEQLSDIIQLVNRRLNANLRLTGLIPTMCDRRKKITPRLIEKMQDMYGRNLVRPRIRLDAKLAEAPARGKPIHLYAPASNGAYDYTVLADDIRLM